MNQTTIFEIRTDGSNTNGGAYDPSISGGTDYTYPTQTVISYTDIVCTNATAAAPTISSVSRPFVTADKGNTLYFPAAAGVLNKRATITAVSGGVATLGEAIGSTASISGVSATLGGALAYIDPFFLLGVITVTTGSGIAYMRGGTYTRVTTNTPAQITTIRVVGYGTTRGDGGIPVILAGATSITLLNAGAFGSSIQFVGIKFDGATLTGVTGFAQSTGGSATNPIVFNQCQFVRFTVAGIAYTPAGATVMHVSNCYFSANTGISINSPSSPISIIDSFFDACTGGSGSGIVLARDLIVNGTIFSYSTGAGAILLILTNAATHTVIRSNTFHANPASAIAKGIAFSASGNTVAKVSIKMNLFANLTTGIDANTNGNMDTVYLNWNAYYNCTTKSVGGTNTLLHNVIINNEISVTADPFTAASTKDFSLNSTSGGGIACRGISRSLPGSTTSLDYIGAVSAPISQLSYNPLQQYSLIGTS